MTAEQFARICAEQDARHRLDPLFARYIEQRRESARRMLGLPVKETTS